MSYDMTTQRDVRAAFWDQWTGDACYRKSYRQNQYSATVRCDFVDFVDGLQKDGRISEALAARVTL